MPMRFNRLRGLGASCAGATAAALGTNPAAPGMQQNPGGAFIGILDPQVDGADFFFYVTNPGTLDHGDSANSNIQIDNGTDFLLLAMTYQADISGASQTINDLVVPLVTLNIMDTGSTKNLMNSPVPLNCIAGTGEFPYRLPRARMFRANSVIQFSWTSYEDSTDYSNIYLTLHGIRTLAGAISA